jgi:hypothetical protein
MSYEKKAAAGAVPAYIVFYYTIDALFSDASMRSMFRSKNVKPVEENKLPTSSFALQDEEKTIATDLLRDAVFELFSRFAKYGAGLTDTIKHNVDYTPTGGSSAKTSYLKMVDNALCAEIYIRLTDELLLKCLRFSVLRDWFESQGGQEAAKEYNQLYLSSLLDLQKASLELKKPKL